MFAHFDELAFGYRFESVVSRKEALCEEFGVVWRGGECLLEIVGMRIEFCAVRRDLSRLKGKLRFLAVLDR